jgi:hypothetical protein
MVMKLTNPLLAGLTVTCLVAVGLSTAAHAGDRYSVGKSQPSEKFHPGGAFWFSESLSGGPFYEGPPQPGPQKLQQPSTFGNQPSAPATTGKRFIGRKPQFRNGT